MTPNKKCDEEDVDSICTDSDGGFGVFDQQVDDLLDILQEVQQFKDEKNDKTHVESYLKKSSKSKTAMANLSLLTAMIGVTYKDGDIHLPWEIRSLSEEKIKQVIKKKLRPFWLKHHMTHLTRVFPKGARFDSSNYSPIPAWASGSQFVALNFQTKDESQLLN